MKSPEVRPGEFHCQLKILVLLILNPAYTRNQLLHLLLCLPLEKGPVGHVVVDRRRRSDDDDAAAAAAAVYPTSLAPNWGLCVDNLHRQHAQETAGCHFL